MDKAAEASKEDAAGGLDFFSAFWEDPPKPIPGKSGKTTKSDLKSGKGAGGGADQQLRRFELPGLPRCEVRFREAGGVVEQAKSSSTLAAECKLWPGLREAFQQYP